MHYRRNKVKSPLWTARALVGGTVLCTTFSQLLFKWAGAYSTSHSRFATAWLQNPWLWAAFVMMAFGMLSWTLALRHLPLSTAYPWTALTYVFTPLLSAALFHDSLTWQYLVGIGCIFAGILVTMSSTRDVA
jgi:drug/metabolite transporter (DMT)-like permease